MIYPISETFTSIQGEGSYTGTRMFFLRLAGCNVGKYMGEAPEIPFRETLPALETEAVARNIHSYCTAWNGERFCCDTDYRKTGTVTAEDLVARFQESGAEHLCITGGEPLIHGLEPLLEVLDSIYCQVHLETSGTKPISEEVVRRAWITCSPKQGFLSENSNLPDEWKFVVSPQTSLESIETFLETHNSEDENVPVYIQPLNGISKIWNASLRACLAILEVHPEWKLSGQLHKYLEVR